MLMASDRKVNEMPMTMGRREPTRQMGNSCTRVPMPAITIQFCISAALMALSRPTAAANIMMGVMLLTNMANTCCRPKGNALANGTRPSSWYRFSIDAFIKIMIYFFDGQRYKKKLVLVM